MAFRRVFISIPNHILKQLDEAVVTDSSTRSAYIREAVMLRLSIERYVEDQAGHPNAKASLIHKVYYQIKSHREHNLNKKDYDLRE